MRGARTGVNAAGADGLIAGGGARLLGIQALAVLVAAAYSGFVTFLLLYLLKRTVGLTVTFVQESAGLDIVEHDLEAYRQHTRTASVERLEDSLIGSYASMEPAAASEMRSIAETVYVEPSVNRAPTGGEPPVEPDASGSQPLLPSRPRPTRDPVRSMPPTQRQASRIRAMQQNPARLREADRHRRHELESPEAHLMAREADA